MNSIVLLHGLARPVRLLLLGFAVVAGSVLPSGGAHAVTGPPKLALHVRPYAQKGVCTTAAPPAVGCNAPAAPLLVTGGDLNTEYLVYVLAVDVDPARGISGAEFGIYYDYRSPASEGSGVDIFSWTPCMEIEFPGAAWPASGSGISLSGTCRGNTPDPTDPDGAGFAVLGALGVFAHSPDALILVQRFDKNFEFTARDCQGVVYGSDPSQAGIAAFGSGGSQGFNPCLGWFDRFPSTCCLPGECRTLDPLYCDYLGGAPLGFRPCSECAVPVDAVSWGRIKTRHD